MMLSNNLKRVILIYVDLIISMLIWNINQNIFGNPLIICLILSTTTFLIIYTPFEIYWNFRDIWLDRWKEFYPKDLIISKLRIPIRSGHKRKYRHLSAVLIYPQDNQIALLKNSIVVICHGFSDSKETLQNYYFPLVYNGHIVLVYDARGTGESRKLGRRSQFLKRIDDYRKVIEWIKSNKDFRNKRIFSIGFSIGAITVLCGGFQNKIIEKIIAISGISIYNKNLPRFNPLIILNYFLKGVRLFPKEQENQKLSPYLIFKELHSKMDKEDWKRLTSRVMLIHSQNDRIIKFKNFEENSSILSLPEYNKLTLKKGGHTHKKNELILVACTLEFLDR
jgi:pimeloyl-ACP methyl ester carboxylesterase